MWELLSGLREKLLGNRGISIDNEVFRLHYRYTLMILAVFALIITSRQYLGDPIECFSYSGKDIPTDALNLYCWVQTTFILPKAFDKKVGVEVIAPGVDNQQPGDEKIYLKYYQWVGLFLAFQAVMFYITRFVWKALEGGRVESLVLDFGKPIIKTADGEPNAAELRELLADYLFETRKDHTLYFFKFFACEILNFVHVVLQIYLVDNFLGGEFRTYGPDVVKFMNMNQEDRTDPMIKIFPRITKCTFNKFGSSGSIQNHDVFCVLPINIMNEKIFVFMWFWFLVLALCSGLVIAYRILLVVFPGLKKISFTEGYGLHFQEKEKDSKKHNVLFTESLGFWLLLKLLGKNMDHVHFQQILILLTDKLREEKAKNISKIN